MNLLITGATGYVGTHLIPLLVEKHPNIKILTVNRDVEKAEKLLNFAQCTHISTNDCESIIAFNPSIVFHLATLSTSSNNKEIIDPLITANISLGVHLLDTLSKCTDLKLFVNVGSFAEYRLGTEKISDAYLYTASKSAFRAFVDYYSTLSGFKYLTAVPYTIYGDLYEGKKIIDHIRNSINSPTPVDMTKGEQILDFIHVNDVAAFFVSIVDNFDDIIKNMPNAQEFFVGTGKGTSIKELAQLIEQTANKKCNINWGGLAYRDLDVMHAVAPIERNNKIIKWQAQISLAKGIATSKSSLS